jgi:hypothetical protein
MIANASTPISNENGICKMFDLPGKSNGTNLHFGSYRPFVPS